MSPFSLPSRRRVVLAAAVLLAATLGVQSPAQAATASTTAASHRSATSAAAPQIRTSAVAPHTGWAGGVLYSPARADGVKRPLVIAMPGLDGSARDLAVYGRALAAQDFNVLVMNTLAKDDYSDDRAKQVTAALSFVKGDAGIRQRVDVTRVAALGYSLGGGADLSLAATTSDFRAVVGLAPFQLAFAGGAYDTTMPKDVTRTPTLIITGEKDTVAPAETQGAAYYKQLDPRTPRTYLNLKGVTHEGFTRYDADIVTATVAFLKVHLAGGSSYAKFICPVPAKPSILVSDSHC
jgi:dienelactone hydrolase